MKSSFIEQCEAEQLHLSGHIQNHGALIVLTQSGLVSHLSANLNRFIPADIPVQIDARLPDIYASLLDDMPLHPGQHIYGVLPGSSDSLYDVVLSRSEQHQFIEIYNDQNGYQLATEKLQFPAGFDNEAEAEHFRQLMLSWIQLSTRHQRVMYYQFLANGDGQVTAEVCTEKRLGTYEGLRFPASDIPEIARKLYIKAPWREIPDAASPATGIIGKGTSPDLTSVDLRSVSPVHIQYMNNMGVGSSVSFPIVKSGELDALISCHSSHKHQLTRETLSQVASVIAEYTLRKRELSARRRLTFIDEFNFKTRAIRDLLRKKAPAETIWEELAPLLIAHFNVDGVYLCTDNYNLSYAAAPEPELMQMVDNFFNQKAEQLSFNTDHIKGLINNLPLTETAGIAGVKIQTGFNRKNNLRLYLSKGEFIHEVNWGGNPNKPIEVSDKKIPISPRFSFEKWIETRLGYSHPWPETINLELLRIKNMLEKSDSFSLNTQSL